MMRSPDHGSPDPLAHAHTSPDPRPGQAAVPPLRPGARIGRFTVLDKLGEGGMGVVLAAYDPDLDRRVAIKLIRPAAAKDEGAQARLLREAQAMARLRHPNVVTVYEVGTFGEQVFIAMEYVEGRTLSGALAELAGSWREIIARFAEAGRGLAAAHEAGLVHRDFKPENVLVGRDGRVHVTDFGLVGTADESEGSRPFDVLEDNRARVSALSSPLLEEDLTPTGYLMGTPLYMSPEHHRGGCVDARSDQFAFCVGLFRELYGESPFDGETVTEYASQVLAGNVRPPPTGTRVPGWVRDILLRGLSVDPDRRFPSMEALLSELAVDEHRDRRGGWRTRLVLGVVMGAIWLGLPLAWQLTRGDAPPPFEALDLVVALSLCVFVFGVGVWAREAISRNSYNRSLFGGVVVASLGMAAFQAAALLAGIPMTSLQIFYPGLSFLCLAMLAVTVERRLLIASAGFLAALLTSGSRPEWRNVAMVAAHFVLVSSCLWMWWPRAGIVASGQGLAGLRSKSGKHGSTSRVRATRT
jgi:predicted Ser/Thr protein kinase